MKPVPDQETGGHSDNVYRVQCTSKVEAQHLYAIACRNLLAVNNWGNITPNLVSADFILCDETGKPVNRFPKENDYIKIDIPGPGPKESKGYDWVIIEELGNETDFGNDTEYTFIRVRPADDPDSNKVETVHFFSEEANSTFMVKRSGNTVIGEIHGRNEKPNLGTGSTIDNIRNAIVANLAMARFSDSQWKELSKAFLTYSSHLKH